MSLYELLQREIKRMVSGVDYHKDGNIYPLVMEEVEYYIIDIVLRETNFNIVRSAQLLGIGRNTLYRKMKQYALVKNEKKGE